MAANTQITSHSMRRDITTGTNTRRRRVSIFGPAVLIVIGLLFLLNNLNAMPGNGWSLVWTYWPLLFVIVGLDDILHSNFGGAMLSVGLGAILLLVNLGVLPGWGMWDLLRLWPVFLVIGGISLLLSGLRSPMASVLGGAIALAVLVGAVVWLRPALPTGAVLNSERISQSLEGAHRAEVTLVTSGYVRVAAMPKSEDLGLIAGQVDTRNGPAVRRNFSRNGDTAIYSLSSDGVDVYVGPNTTPRWDLKLNPSVPMALDIKLGAGDADLNLTQLYVTQLKVNAGVGVATVTLPDSGQYRAEVRGGVGRINLIIPRGLAARIQASAGLGNATLPEGLVREGDVYLTPNYSNAESRVDLQVAQGIGQLVVEQR